MLFTRPCQYAIRAMAHFVSYDKGRLCQAQEIARSQNIPGPFLATVLGDLVRADLMRSYKGPKGGFCLARPAHQITLYQIMEAVGSLSSLTRCAVGLEDCKGDNLCPLHDQWQSVRQGVLEYLQSVTVADMAAALARKKELRAHSEGSSSPQPGPGASSGDS